MSKLSARFSLFLRLPTKSVSSLRRTASVASVQLKWHHLSLLIYLPKPYIHMFAQMVGLADVKPRTYGKTLRHKLVTFFGTYTGRKDVLLRKLSAKINEEDDADFLEAIENALNPPKLELMRKMDFDVTRNHQVALPDQKVDLSEIIIPDEEAELAAICGIAVIQDLEDQERVLLDYTEIIKVSPHEVIQVVYILWW